MNILHRHLGVVIFLVTLLWTADAWAKFSTQKIKRKYAKLERKFDPNESGVGAIKVEKEMVKYLAKFARRAKKASLKKRLERDILTHLTRIKRMNALRQVHTFRGMWAVTLGDLSTLHFHFTQHDMATDFVYGEISTDDGAEPFGFFAGFQRFSSCSVKDVFGETTYYLVQPPNSRTMFTGAVADSSGTYGATGVRLRGP